MFLQNSLVSTNISSLKASDVVYQQCPQPSGVADAILPSAILIWLVDKLSVDRVISNADYWDLQSKSKSGQLNGQSQKYFKQDISGFDNNLSSRIFQPGFLIDQ